MIAELEAIKAHLEAVLSPLTGHIADAGDAIGPYFIVWAGVGDMPADESSGGPCGEFSGQVGITGTAMSPKAALNIAHDALQALTPGRAPRSLPGVTGRHVELSYVGSRPVQVDRSVTGVVSNTHPAYAVVLFDVHSQPLN